MIPVVYRTDAGPTGLHFYESLDGLDLAYLNPDPVEQLADTECARQLAVGLVWCWAWRSPREAIDPIEWTAVECALLPPGASEWLIDHGDGPYTIDVAEDDAVRGGGEGFQIHTSPTAMYTGRCSVRGWVNGYEVEVRPGDLVDTSTTPPTVIRNLAAENLTVTVTRVDGDPAETDR